MSDRFAVAQISDMHIRAAAREDGFDPSADLVRALAAIREFGADVIIATGDLANDAQADEYQALAALIADPPAPIFLVPGNHDDPALMRAALPSHTYLPPSGALSYTVEDYPVRIVAVDQIVQGETGGDFTEAHAAWLEHTLSAAPAKPTLVALHHPPFPTHDMLLDTIALAHQERFAAVIARHPQVQLIVCGHHHRAVLGRVAHAPAIIAPSTAWSFGLALNPDHPLAKRDHKGKGWALHLWSGDHRFASHFMDL